MPDFSLDHLTETEFEQFCYDLLKELGFVNLNWRKGTGLSSSPSDQGRDIECEYLREEVDGRQEFEKWFVECKHYRQGVPPDKIQGALSWANAMRPDKLLIIASNFLSNSAKNYINDYISNKPPYKIRYWEKPDLERMTANKSTLLKRYKIGNDFSFVSIMHPSHLAYLQRYPLNSLDFLMKLLDKLNPTIRETFLYEANKYILHLSDSYHSFDYETFKQKCFELVKAGYIDERILTYFIVSYNLQMILALGDTTAISKKQAEHTKILPKLKESLEASKPPDEYSLELTNYYFDQFTKTNIPPEDKTFTNMMSDFVQKFIIGGLPDRAKRYYEYYVYLCDNVVDKLLLEKYLHDQDQ